jgi:hypothetical protein
MHTKGQAVEFIEKCFGQSTLSNGGLNASVVCPKCAELKDDLQKRKLVIRTTDFLTHCWVCGYRSSNLTNLLTEYHPFFLDEYHDRFKVKQEYKQCGLSIKDMFDGHTQSEPERQVQLPTGFIMIASNLNRKIKHVDDAWRYLRTRGVTESELWYWKFGVTDYKPPKGEQNFRFRVITPSFDQDGDLNFFSARAYWDKLSGQKYINPNLPRENVVFNEINIDWSEELVITEGVYDLIKCSTNATCLLGSTLDASYRLFQQIVFHGTPVLLALDNDAKHKTYKLAKLFLEYGITVRILDVPTAYNDVGQMTKQEFLVCAENARTFTNQDFFKWKLS